MTVTGYKLFWVTMALGASTLAVSLLVMIDVLFDLHHMPLWAAIGVLAPFLVLQIVATKRCFNFPTNVQGVLSSIVVGSFLFFIGALLSCLFQTFLDLYLDLWAKTSR